MTPARGRGRERRVRRRAANWTRGTVGAGDLVLAVIGAALLAAITPTSSNVWLFLPGLILLSLGLGLSMVSLTMLATSRVPEQDAGLASGLFTAVSYIGGALGLAVLSSLAAASVTAAPGGQVDGFRVAFIASAVLLGAAAPLIVTLIRRHHLAALMQPPAETTTPGIAG